MVPPERWKIFLYISYLVQIILSLIWPHHTMLQNSVTNSQFRKVAKFSTEGITMNCLLVNVYNTKVKINHPYEREINCLSVSYTGLIYLCAVWPYHSVLHSCKRCTQFQPMLEFSASNFIVTYIRNRLALNKDIINIIMTTDERWDGKLIYSLHSHFGLFTIQFHPTRPCCKDPWQVAKFCIMDHHVTPCFKLMQLGTGTPNLLSILFSWSHFCDSAVVYAACLICWYSLLLITAASEIILWTYLRLHWQNIFHCQVSTSSLLKLI